MYKCKMAPLAYYITIDITVFDSISIIASFEQIFVLLSIHTSLLV
jgi:hypothetical protein